MNTAVCRVMGWEPAIADWIVRLKALQHKNDMGPSAGLSRQALVLFRAPQKSCSVGVRPLHPLCTAQTVASALSSVRYWAISCSAGVARKHS